MIKTRLIKLSLLLLFLFASQIEVTNSFLHDKEYLLANTFQAACWGAPSTPSRITPAYISTKETSIYFSWNITTNHCPNAIIAYKILIATNPQFSENLQEWGWMTDNYHTVNDLIEGRYWWKILAKDQYGYQSESLMYELIVDRSIQVPILESPSDRSWVKSKPSLYQRWHENNDASGPVSYYYESCNVDPRLHNNICPSIRYTKTYADSDAQLINNQWLIVKNSTNGAEGTFWWRVKAADTLGNVSGWSNVWQLNIDNTPPIPSLSVKESSWSKAVTERFDNGGFENNLDGWSIAGDVSVVNVDNVIFPDPTPSVEVKPKNGTKMLRIGNYYYPEDQGNMVWENRVMKSIDTGVKSISLFYNFFSLDYLDNPGFFIRINGQNIFELSSDSLLSSGINTDWNRFHYDLSEIDDPVINLAIYSGNTTDDINQSWTYIDNITTYFVSTKPQAQFNIMAGDPAQSGIIPSGINRCEYKIGSGAWTQGYTFNIINGGTYNLQYQCTDNAGNTSTTKQVTVIIDDQSPSAITDLEITGTDPNSITIQWTAPGNDGDSNRSSKYDIRYSAIASSDTSCTPSNFNFETAVKINNVPAPYDPGYLESLEIPGLNRNTKYCIAIKTADEAPNWSALSNIVLGQTTTGPTYDAGDIVINELMWMGSEISDVDEFIELRNMTDHTISLEGFMLTKLSGGSEENMAISLDGKYIAPYGYFLIANGNSYTSGNSKLKDNVTPQIWDSSLDLSDLTLQIKLYDNNGNLIDTAWNGTEPKEGLHDPINSKYYSMERTATPGDGTNELNWYTCIDEASRNEFFDPGSDTRGTPGTGNRSENEPYSRTILQPTKEPSASFNISDDGKSLFFEVKNIGRFISLNYKISNSIGKVFAEDEMSISNQDIIKIEGIILSTCSGDICTTIDDITNIRLELILKDREDKIISLRLSL